MGMTWYNLLSCCLGCLAKTPESCEPRCSDLHVEGSLPKREQWWDKLHLPTRLSLKKVGKMLELWWARTKLQWAANWLPCCHPHGCWPKTGSLKEGSKGPCPVWVAWCSKILNQLEFVPMDPKLLSHNLIFGRWQHSEIQDIEYDWIIYIYI